MFIRGLLISLMLMASSFAQAQSECESAAARVKASPDGKQDSRDIRDIEKRTVESAATEEAFDKVLANPTGTVKTQNSDLKNAAVIISSSTQQAMNELQPLVSKCNEACKAAGEEDKCSSGQDRLDKYAAEKARADELAAKGDDYEDQTGGKSGKDSSANGDQKNQGQQAGQGGGSPGGGSPSSPTDQNNQVATPPPTCDNGLSSDPVCQKQAPVPPETFLPVAKLSDASTSDSAGTSSAENRSQTQLDDGTAGQAVGNAAANMSGYGSGGGSGAFSSSGGNATERGGGGVVRNGTDQDALRALAVNGGSTGGSGSSGGAGSGSGSTSSSIANGSAGHTVGSALTNSVVGRMKAMATSLRRGPAGLPGRDGITASLGPDLWRKVRVRYSESRLIP